MKERNLVSVVDQEFWSFTGILLPCCYFQHVSLLKTTEYRFTQIFYASFLFKAEGIHKIFVVIDKKIADVIDLQSSLLEFSDTDDSNV